MQRINLIFTLYSLNALIVIIERLSPTTQVLLQPFNYIRLHELIQTNVLLLISVILSIMVLKFVTNNFQLLKEKSNFFWTLLFISGVYLYGVGEAWHEVASFTLNQYCNLNNIQGNLCGGLFVNDYFTGNIIFFIGGVIMNISLLALSIKTPIDKFDNKNLVILFLNSLVFGFTWFAYAAFDRVLIGFYFLILLTIISLFFFIKTKSRLREYPYVLYSLTAYIFATLATIVVRFLKI